MDSSKRRSPSKNSSPSENRLLPENQIIQGDCIEQMKALPEGCVDLVFADPPFNIGYKYDVYDDRRSADDYLDWSQQWMEQVVRILKSDGTFWLAIGDEFAAELKVLMQRKLGLRCRSWVVWYYTFGVNCKKKFTRSHAHLFYMVKDPKKFTFNGDDLENRVPSARQLVYGDSRANPNGRLPDDTWILRPSNASGVAETDDLVLPLDRQDDTDQTWVLRPQDIENCFRTDEDTWYLPRVAGTFKERAGFHGCQMPEQLLGRIIRTCSNPGDFVVDPFSGSATTVAVAKKLGRRHLGLELSKEYVLFGNERLGSVRIGDPLEGAEEPTMSAPATRSRALKRRQTKSGKYADVSNNADLSKRKQRLEAGIVEAFWSTSDGYSVDRIVADKDLNARFAEECRSFGLMGDLRTWNRMLFAMRKAGKLSSFPTTKRTIVRWEDCDQFLFASEIALEDMIRSGWASSLDDILCDPALADKFDELAIELAPGFSSLQYRLGALKLRKQAKTARVRAEHLKPPKRLGTKVDVFAVRLEDLHEGPGVYILSGKGKPYIYVGETLHLRDRFRRQFSKQTTSFWQAYENLQFQWRETETDAAHMLAWQSLLIQKHKPLLNSRELRAAA